MAKYKLELRHRARPDESIEVRHKRFIENISTLGMVWDLRGLGLLPSIGSELVLIVSLNKALGAGFKGRLTYSYRSEQYLENDAQYDDTLFIEFSSEKVDFEDFVKRIFPAYVQAFDCYRATLHDWDLARGDWPKILEESEIAGRDVNGRTGVYRINAINYFDNELCELAFGLSSAQIVDRLKGAVEYVSLLGDGVIFVYTSRVLVGDELGKVDSEVRLLLREEKKGTDLFN